MKQERIYVAWMAGAVVSALALVGVVAAANVDKTPASQMITQMADIPAGARLLGPGEPCTGRRIKTKAGTNLCLGGNVPFGLTPEDTAPEDTAPEDTGPAKLAPASFAFSPYITEPQPCPATDSSALASV
jgi:hypothetical protein